MATNIQIIKDTTRSTLIKLIGDGAETNKKVVTANSLFGALNTNHEYLMLNGAVNGTAKTYYDLSFYRAWYDINSNSGGKIVLYWDAPTKVPIISMGWSGSYNEEGNWSTITNPLKDTTGVAGDIVMDAINVTGFTVIFEVVKDHKYYDSGEVYNPEAFNYGKYGIKP